MCLKHTLIFILIASSSMSCDDGDIIVTSFDFTGQTVNLCRTTMVNDTTNVKYVFSKINAETKEALAVEFQTSDPILREPTQTAPYTVQINGTNSQVTYRRFDAAPGTDYFCNNIPPASPQVMDEYTSVEGIVEITTNGTPLDDDGILAVDEMTLNGKTDLDGDGLPNIYDFDDDGDNVPTRNEGVKFKADKSIDMAASQDTDKDGIPDFMDPDDDGDGVLTRDEDLDGDLIPNNDVTDPAVGPDYLNANITKVTKATRYIRHTYTLNDVKVTLVLKNLFFRNSNADDSIKQTQLLFETFNSNIQTISVRPDFPTQ